MGKKSKKGQSRAGNKKRPAAGKSKANKKSTGSVASKDLPVAVDAVKTKPTTQPPPKNIVVDNKENETATLDDPLTPASKPAPFTNDSEPQRFETTPMAVGDVVEKEAETPAAVTPVIKAPPPPAAVEETPIKTPAVTSPALEVPPEPNSTPAVSTPVKATNKAPSTSTKTPEKETLPQNKSVWDSTLRDAVKNATPPQPDVKPVLDVTPMKGGDRALDFSTPDHKELQTKTTECGCVIS